MVDWISTLPDAILSFILSFLPTKQAVATSVLSKRWKPLWRSVPTLDLDDRGFWRDKEGYARFVQGVRALFRDLHHPIQKLRLWSVSQFTDLADVSIWLNAAVQRRIQHLNLNLARRPINLSSMLSCKTLVVLKLDYIKLEPISSVDLPSLKVLQLRCLSFSELGCLVELLSGCPVLEDFTEYNLTFESDLYYDEDVTGEFKTLGKLLRANISNTNINVMLELVNNVKFLHIDSIEGFSLLGLDPYHFEAPRPYVFPMFHNLTHIELQYRNYNNDWSEALELLKYCPELQVIVIDQPNINAFAFELSEEEPKNWRYTPSFPECILLHLKECYLNDYRGTKGEFQFARHVMQNGRSLKKMTICSGDGINQQRRLELLEKLSSCTRHSATCELYFE